MTERRTKEPAPNLPIGDTMVGGKSFSVFKSRGGMEAMHFSAGYQIHYTTANGAVERKFARGSWSAWRHNEEFTRLLKEIDK